MIAGRCSDGGSAFFSSVRRSERIHKNEMHDVLDVGIGSCSHTMITSKQHRQTAIGCRRREEAAAARGRMQVEAQMVVVEGKRSGSCCVVARIPCPV